MSLSIADIIQRARSETGNKDDRSPSEVTIPDSDVEAGLKSVIRNLNQRFGSTTGLKEAIFNAVNGTQDYDIATNVGNDVSQIVDVYREDAFVSDYQFDDGRVLPRTDTTNSQALVHPGLQSNVFRTIFAQQRSERAAEFAWEQVGSNLRLYPPPSHAEVIGVKYSTTGASIDTLPDQCEEVLVKAAVVAILNGEINRIGSNRAFSKAFGEPEQVRVVELRKQRDFYVGQYREELARLG